MPVARDLAQVLKPNPGPPAAGLALATPRLRVCVTGCTGSFGRAFLRAVLDHRLVDRLVGISRDELKQAELADELGAPEALRLFLADVRDVDRLRQAFTDCEIVVHAAALKRVDQVAYNPTEVLKTNVLGTQNVIEAALRTGVRKVLVISSDKAVEPCTAYGTSKAFAESLAVSANTYAWPQGTRVACVRYGNVLGSRGSVVHVFRRAIREGRPIPITNPTCTRFWITLEQAVALVLRALATMRGGEIFVPVLPSLRVVELAEAVLCEARPEWTGPPGDHVIGWSEGGYPAQIIGLRPGGEKLHERLLTQEEASRTVHSGPDYVVHPSHRSWSVEPWPGEPVPATLDYTSDRNERWLTVEEMQKWLERAP